MIKYELERAISLVLTWFILLLLIIVVIQYFLLLSVGLNLNRFILSLTMILYFWMQEKWIWIFWTLETEENVYNSQNKLILNITNNNLEYYLWISITELLSSFLFFFLLFFFFCYSSFFFFLLPSSFFLLPYSIFFVTILELSRNFYFVNCAYWYLISPIHYNLPCSKTLLICIRYGGSLPLFKIFRF